MDEATEEAAAFNLLESCLTTAAKKSEHVRERMTRTRPLPEPTTARVAKRRVVVV
jgi:hypothetical protein